MKKAIFWVPRVLAIVFVVFLALMSLDVFSENYGFWGTALALLMHNIPTLILLAVLLISWKYEIIGGIGFILAGVAYIVLTLTAIIKTGFEWYYLSWIIQIAGLSFLVGILFLVGWMRKRKIRGA